MNRVEKKSGSKSCSAHCFPSIQPSSEHLSQRDGQETHSFRPLYQTMNGSNDGRRSDFRHQGRPNENSPIEESGSESYSRGFEAGKAEACKIVQRELDVPIRQFSHQNARFRDCYTQITDIYGDQIVKLTLAIAQSILGNHFELDVERQEPIRHLLQSFLKRQYQLSMKMNGDDLKTLSDIMAYEDPQWNQSSALDITGDAAIQKGQINMASAVSIPESLQEKFNQEFEVLLSGT